MRRTNLKISEAEPVRAHRPLGRHLVDAGVIANEDLLHALDRQHHVDALLGEILISEGLLDRKDMLRALADQHAAPFADLDADPPNPMLAHHIPAAHALRHAALPWKEMGGALLVATSRPDQFDALREILGPDGPTILPVIADGQQVQSHQSRIHGPQLARQAAQRVLSSESCRDWKIDGWGRVIIGISALCLFLGVLTFWPQQTVAGLAILAVATLVMTASLKALALGAQLIHRLPEREVDPPLHPGMPFRMPKVSILVPLLQEKEIAGALVTRLSRLTYPKSQLQVLLVLEAGDRITRETLARTQLPPWISTIEVPEANRLTTKPRALNYALDFCDGSIIGVWDAEDAPEADQLERIVSRFQTAPANVACLQGILDYYNASANWLSRCFTIEYASWWRMILPGVARLGMIIPLGGTTLFFRRHILEELRGWDAHNVTEDADLGVRLARRGYVTELVSTVTYEEANCRLWPWVRQRSRWLKGFLITWCVHMRRPVRLWRDVGTVRFLGLQTMLFATFCQFALAPVLWSFWLILLGLGHPVAEILGSATLWSFVGVFILAETLNLLLAMVAVSGKEHRFLMPWVFTMPLYFVFGAFAASKALYEFVACPFYWDKTDHGVTPEPPDDNEPQGGFGPRGTG